MENFVYKVVALFASGLSSGLIFGVAVMLVPVLLNIFKKSTE